MEAVYLWRGSPEQRALRAQAGRSGQFSYFDRQLGHPPWRGKQVLDFGGSDGRLLLDPHCTIRPEDYTCLDVVREAQEEGRERFPAARWIHYDRYNCSFNPTGVPGLPVPDPGVRYDMIVAYSVFTHTTREDMHELTGQLRALLAPEGVLAFTFIDPHARSWPERYDGNNLQWRLERFRESDPELQMQIDVEGLLEQSRGAEWCALVDGRELSVDGNGGWLDDAARCMSYHVYYTAERMQQEFPDATIRPPVNGEMQHCCILRRSA